MENIIFDRIRRDLSQHRVVLYMNGPAVYPHCAASATIVQILSQLGVSFKDIDVADDGELQQGLNDFANWPTIPQLYVNGNFVGGSDIVREMYEKGELQRLVNNSD